jgi:hypothetical protein
MSEDTPFIQPPQSPPIPPSPPPRSSAGYRPPSPAYQPVYYQQPPTRPAGCAQFFIHGLAALGVLAALGLGLFLGSFFLLSVAIGTFDEIAL